MAPLALTGCRPHNEAFVDLRRAASPKGKTTPPEKPEAKPGARLGAGPVPQLRQHLQSLMAFELTAEDGKTVREETDENEGEVSDFLSLLDELGGSA